MAKYDITDDQYTKAISWLDNGGTKKGACEILGVSSNSTMERLIKEFVEGKERDKRLRAKKRKQPITKGEIAEFVTEYLNGASFSELADRHYRSAALIKYHIESNGALLRHTGKIDFRKPPIMPDACVAYSFEVGQYVWSARYNCVAQVDGIYKDAYKIQVLSNGTQEKAYQAVSELGSLKHLEALGVDLSKFQDYMKGDEVVLTLNKTLINARKNNAKNR